MASPAVLHGLAITTYDMGLPSHDEASERVLANGGQSVTKILARKLDNLMWHIEPGDFQNCCPWELAYDICLQGSDRHDLMLVPASGQVIDRQRQPVPNQEQYQEWLILGVSFWHSDGQLTPITVATWAAAGQHAQALYYSHPSAASMITGSEPLQLHQPQVPLPASPATTSAEQDGLQQQQQYTAVYQAPGFIYVSNHTTIPLTALDLAIAAIPPGPWLVTEQQAQQLLLLVTNTHNSMQQVLQALLQQRGQLAYVLFLEYVLASQQAPLVVATLAADRGALLLRFLEVLSSSNLQTALVALDVLEDITAAADADQLLPVILEADQGVQLLSKALVDRHNLTEPCKTAECGGSDYYMLDSPVAAAVCDLFDKGVVVGDPEEVYHSSIQRTLAERCAALLESNVEQLDSETSRQVALLLVLASTHPYERTDGQLFLWALAPLLEGAVTQGTAQTQYLSTLWSAVGSLDPCGHQDQQMLAWLAQHDMVPLLSVMLQQGPEADLAAHIMSCLFTTPSRSQLLMNYTYMNLLFDVVSRTSSTWVGACTLHLLCKYGHSGEQGFGVIFSHLELIIGALARFTGCRGEDADPTIYIFREQLRSLKVSGLEFICKVAEMVIIEATLLAGGDLTQHLGMFLRQASSLVQPTDDPTSPEHTALALAAMPVYLAAHPAGLQLVLASYDLGVFNSILQTHLGTLDCYQLEDRDHPEVLSFYHFLQPTFETLGLLLQSAAADQVGQPASAPLAVEEVLQMAQGTEQLATKQLATLTNVLIQATRHAGLIEGALECLRCLAVLPCGAFQCVLCCGALNKCLPEALASGDPNMYGIDRQQCQEILATVERRTSLLQARLMITPSHAHSNMQEAAVKFAQFHEQHRRDPYDQSLHSSFVAAACDLVSMAMYMETAEHLCKSVMEVGGEAPAEGAATA